MIAVKDSPLAGIGDIAALNLKKIWLISEFRGGQSEMLTK